MGGVRRAGRHREQGQREGEKERGQSGAGRHARECAVQRAEGVAANAVLWTRCVGARGSVDEV